MAWPSDRADGKKRAGVTGEKSEWHSSGAQDGRNSHNKANSQVHGISWGTQIRMCSGGGGVQRAGGRAASDDLPTKERKEHQSVGHPHSGTECGSLSVVIYTQNFTQDCRKKCTHEQSTIYAQNF